MKVKNFKKLILPSAFMIIIVGLSLFTFALPKKEYSEKEKRYLTKFPEFTLESIANGDFQDGFEKYVSDHIPVRDFFVGLNSYFSLAMGRNSVSDIYYGKDGYLINAPKNSDTENFEKNLKNFNVFSKSVKIPSSILIVPRTGYIMEDKLPLFHAEYDDDTFFKTASEITTGMNFIDTRKVLFDAAKDRQVYYRTDHHLTTGGTYELYKQYCELNGLGYPKEDSYIIKKTDGFLGTAASASGYNLTKGDTVEMWVGSENVTITINDGSSDKVYDTMFFEEHLKKDDKYPVFLDGNHALTIIENDEVKSGNLLLIKDSYAHALAPFLAHNYNKIYLVDMRYYRKSVSELIDENDIDSILYIYGLDTLITDTNSAWLQ